MRENKIVLHFKCKCSSLNGTILLVVQQNYIYKSNRTGSVTDVKYSKTHNEASLAKSDRRSLVFCAYQVGAVLVLYKSSYNIKLLKVRFMVQDGILQMEP